jgi:gluconokinase
MATTRLLSNSITWGDIRASVWAERIKNEFDGEAIYRRTGTPIHPMSPLCKLMWMRHEKAEVFNRAARFVGIKEYVLFRLFGEWLVDYSIASATGMFNLEQLDWDEGALALLRVDAHQLPKPVPTTYQLQGLDAAVAERLGLRTDTPFVIGANDGVLSNLGVNAIASGPGCGHHRHFRRHAHGGRTTGDRCVRTHLLLRTDGAALGGRRAGQ